MEALKKGRRPLRTQITKLSNQLEQEICKASPTRLTIRVNIHLLSDCFKMLDRDDQQIMSLLIAGDYSKAELDLEVKDIMEYKFQVEMIKFKAEKWLQETVNEPVAVKVEVEPTVVLMDKEKPLENDNDEQRITHVEGAEKVVVAESAAVARNSNETDDSSDTYTEVTIENAMKTASSDEPVTYRHQLKRPTDGNVSTSGDNSKNEAQSFGEPTYAINGLQKVKKEPSQRVEFRWWEKPSWVNKAPNSWPPETTRPDERVVRKKQKKYRTVWKPGSKFNVYYPEPELIQWSKEVYYRIPRLGDFVVVNLNDRRTVLIFYPGRCQPTDYSVIVILPQNSDKPLNCFDSDGCWINGCRFRCNWTDFSIQRLMELTVFGSEGCWINLSIQM